MKTEKNQFASEYRSCRVELTGKELDELLILYERADVARQVVGDHESLMDQRKDQATDQGARRAAIRQESQQKRAVLICPSCEEVGRMTLIGQVQGREAVKCGKRGEPATGAQPEDLLEQYPLPETNREEQTKRRTTAKAEEKSRQHRN